MKQWQKNLAIWLALLGIIFGITFLMAFISALAQGNFKANILLFLIVDFLYLRWWYHNDKNQKLH